jgi:hypothetical protein
VLREHGLDPDMGTTSTRSRASASPEPTRTSRAGSEEKDPSNVARGLKAYVVDYGLKETIDNM